MNFFTKLFTAIGRSAGATAAVLVSVALWLFPVSVASAHEYYTENFTFVHPWSDASAPDATEAPVYFVLENIVRADKLLRAYTNLAEAVELRVSGATSDTTLESFDIPERERLEFLPGKAHVQLKGLRAPMQWGRSYAMTFVFEQAGHVTVMVSIGAH